MKLDLKCVRDILMLCEDFDFLSYDLEWVPLSLHYFLQKLPCYKKNQIAYTLIQLDEAGYINAQSVCYDDGIGDIFVERLTYAGHELIDTIRPKSVWDKMSKTISELSEISLPVLQELASHFLIESLTH